MAQESCNLDREEAEILKPSSPSPSSSPSSCPTPPQSSSPPPPLFMNSIQEFSVEKHGISGEPKPTAKKREKSGNRCSSCRRKVGLAGFRCRCGDLFCGQHRHSDVHECSFDYKALGREQISKANPLVRAAKITKI